MAATALGSRRVGEPCLAWHRSHATRAMVAADGCGIPLRPTGRTAMRLSCRAHVVRLPEAAAVLVRYEKGRSNGLGTFRVWLAVAGVGFPAMALGAAGGSYGRLAHGAPYPHR